MKPKLNYLPLLLEHIALHIEEHIALHIQEYKMELLLAVILPYFLPHYLHLAFVNIPEVSFTVFELLPSNTA